MFYSILVKYCINTDDMFVISIVTPNNVVDGKVIGPGSAMLLSSGASAISEGDIFIYSCSAQLISFEIESTSKEINCAEHEYMNMSPSLIALAPLLMLLVTFSPHMKSHPIRTLYPNKIIVSNKLLGLLGLGLGLGSGLGFGSGFLLYA